MIDLSSFVLGALAAGIVVTAVLPAPPVPVAPLSSNVRVVFSDFVRVVGTDLSEGDGSAVSFEAR